MLRHFLAHALRTQRTAFAAQALASAFGCALIGLLIAYGIGPAISDIPGAPCASAFGRLQLMDASGARTDRFFSSQASLLQRLQTAHVYTEARIQASVGSPGATLTGAISVVTDALLPDLCVDADALPPEGAGLPAIWINSVLAANPGQVVQVNQSPAVAASIPRGFSDTVASRTPTLAWIRAGEASQIGYHPSDYASLPHVFLYYRIKEGATHKALQDELDQVVDRNTGAFTASRVVHAGNLRLAAASEKSLRQVQIVLGVITAITVALIAINVGIFQAGRLSHLRRTLQVLLAVGAPPRSRITIASLEPLVMLPAWAGLGAVMAALLHGAALNLLRDPSLEDVLSVHAVIAATVLAAAILAALVAGLRARIALATTFASTTNAPLRGARIRPYLLAAQSLAATTAVTIAIATWAVLADALPDEPGYDLDGLVLYNLTGRDGAEHPGMADIAIAAEASAERATGLKWAFSSNPLPIAQGAGEGITPKTTSGSAEGMRLGPAAGATTGLINRVSPGFFDVIGMDTTVPPVHALRMGPAETVDAEPASVVVNEAFMRLHREGAVIGSVQHLSTLWTSAAPGGAVPVQVMGVVSERTTGNDRGDHALRLQPIAYAPLTRIHWGIANVVAWVRKPPGYPQETLDRTAQTLAASMLPGGTASSPIIAKDLFAAATKPERDATVVTSIIAIGAIAIAAVGLLGLVALIARQQDRSRAAAFAVGASRSRLVAMFLHSTAPPIALGAAAGAGAVVIAAALFREAAGSAASHIALAAVAGTGVVVLMAAACLLGEVRALLKFDPAPHLIAAGE